MSQLTTEAKHSPRGMAERAAWARELPARPEEADGSPVSVERRVFPVVLSDGATYGMVGYRYSGGARQGRSLQLLLHGGTYDHRYWDLPPANGMEYSYARHMASLGYGVLALDLLGAGESAVPQGDLLTLRELALGLHQVISRLRAGAEGEPACSRIALVGHSLGSAVAIATQAAYPGDADAVVTTGMGHVAHEQPVSPDALTALADSEYFGFPPPSREGLFYFAPDADPEVIAYDLATFTGTISRGELRTAMAPTFDPSATRIGEVTGPVLVQLGEHDALYPSTYAGSEAALWPRARVEVQVLPDVGHAVNGHRDHLASWNGIHDWLSRVLGGSA